MWKTLAVGFNLLIFAASASLSYDPFLDIPYKPVKSSADRIKEHGYPAETHIVETHDGYLLKTFRIPYSPKLQNQDTPKPAVLLQHGLFSCSDCFLLNGPENAIAYNFADAGYDVWLGNARGNIYSRNNSKISLNHPSFWRFSWHEIGSIDMPALIDYILEQTGEQKLHYVGHSQGGTAFFVMNSFRPEYNDKLKTSHLLAPAVFMGHSNHVLISPLAPYFGTPGIRTNFMCDQQFVPFNPYVQRALDSACGGNPSFPEFCKTLMLTWGGDDLPNFNTTLLPQIAETHPAGISTNQGIHYIQLKVSDKFRRYDFGTKGNLKKYGQEEPPDYDLENITADTYLYYGLADLPVNSTDVQRLPPLLKSLKLIYEIPIETWGHMDFIFALRVKEIINDKVIGFCDDYEKDN